MAIFDSGTKTIFHQTSAPIGWTKETVNYDNHALRIVSGSTLGSGGSIDFTTAFSTTPYTYSNVPVTHNVGYRTLSVNQLPFHEHSVGPTSTSSTGRYAIAVPQNYIPAIGTAPLTPVVSAASITEAREVGQVVGGSGNHGHAVTITANGNVFNPNSTLSVNYIDVIIASLN